MKTNLHRRALLLGSGASLLAASCKKDSRPAEGSVALPPASATSSAMPMRPLGKTGVSVSIVGIGGFHIGEPSEQEGIRIVRTALDRGINFLDNCWDYNDGKSEERMGKALRDGYRDKAFLMTKLDGRTKQSAQEQLEQSLRRLGTDRIDLVQIHEVIRDSDPDRCFAAGGCVEALVEAKKAGKIRFIGFTGHKHPNIHLAMLRAADTHGFAFDTVQMPLNVMDAHFRSFEHNVLPVLVEKRIGVLGMKSMGSGILLESKTVTPVECLHYAMNLPTSVVITGCDSMGVLEQAISAAISFKPMDKAEVAALLEKTRAAAAEGKYEKFKTSEQFDGTVKNPKWLETATI
ncbi:aldo/keto reductase [Pendulispora brunnea]